MLDNVRSMTVKAVDGRLIPVTTPEPRPNEPQHWHVLTASDGPIVSGLTYRQARAFAQALRAFACIPCAAARVWQNRA